MVKSIITVLVSALIFIGGSICEQVYLNNSFLNFRQRLIVVYEKTEDETITAYDVKSVQDLWIKNKKTLHVFISHNDIKELDESRFCVTVFLLFGLRQSVQCKSWWNS